MRRSATTQAANPAPAGPLGGRHPRPDAWGKVSGQTRYVADLTLPGTLFAGIVASPLPAGRIRRLDLEASRRLGEVVAVLTAREIPGVNSIGVIFPDQPLLAVDRVRMVGERLALVAARSPEAAVAAVRAAAVELEPLPSVHDPVEALATDAPRVHDGGNLVKTFVVERGDLARAGKRAAHVVEVEYRIGGQEHAYLEPQGCLAVPEGRQRLTIHASCQCPFYIQQGVARVLALPLAAVRVVQAPTGGGFGGKEDYPTEPAACAALLAWHTGAPVRLVYSREFDMQVSSKRHAMVIRHRWGADRHGRLCFAEVETFMDAGAYVGLSTVVAERANVSAIGPYHVPAVRVRTHVVHTNNLFGGAFRGFGAPQVTLAGEATMDALARRVGLDPVEFRRRNALDDRRRTTCTGSRLARPVLVRACLERAVALAAAGDVAGATDSRHEVRGTGVGLVLYGCNLHHGGQRLDRSSAVLILQPDGSVVVRVGVTEMGQGLLAAVQTMTAQALGLEPEAVEVCPPDTSAVADSGPTVASRGALVAGYAVLDAVRRLRRKLDPVAAELLGCRVREVELAAGHARIAADPARAVPLAEVAAALAARRMEPVATGWYRSRPRRFDPATGQGDAYDFYAAACHVATVVVDRELGLVRVARVAAVHDVGRVLHRAALEGQIQGGIVQGMGWAISERLVVRQGRLANASFTDYLIPTASDVPAIVIDALEAHGARGPFGSKGIGEPSLIPTAAAVRNAVCSALGIEIAELPLTPPLIVAALGERHPYAWVVQAPRRGTTSHGSESSGG